MFIEVTIYWKDETPADAFTTIFWRGDWIDDEDTDSSIFFYVEEINDIEKMIQAGVETTEDFIVVSYEYKKRILAKNGGVFTINHKDQTASYSPPETCFHVATLYEIATNTNYHA